MPQDDRKQPRFRRLVVFVGAGSLAFSAAQGAVAAQRNDATAPSSDQRAPITRPVDTPAAERPFLRP